MQKFLVIQTAFIGDVVLASAVLEKLHQFFPNDEIDILVRKGNEGLFNHHPFLHEVLIWDKKQDKYKHLFKVLKSIRKRKYDRVINLQRFASTGFLTAFSTDKETLGFKKNPFSFLFSKTFDHDMLHGLHEIERNNTLIESFTDNTFIKPKLYPSDNDFEKVKKYQWILKK
jgi:heptosyltransferase-2